ncbi:D-alanine--D-alanine ligase family protein [Wukongibacter sp. M2B1]|uniref:D-alanine--D-alanine ligase family protein n=1 Tax=Wukongibacter sp. M2B1 TaxID=3088895 RepID=UPI003D7ACC03
MSTEKKLTVALTYNLKKNESNLNEDDEAEFDDLETVNDIKLSLEAIGCEVILLEATSEIVNTIQNRNIDIVFNFAEGLKGRGRESQIPALLNMLSIPFTGSDETTLGVALDKSLAKRIVAYDNIKTPKFQVFFNGKEKLNKRLKYPLIVKPNAEGSSKGIIDTSVAKNNEELYFLINRIITNYNTPALVEEYIDGREFTVGIFGNDDDLEVLPIMEINFDNTKGTGFYSYNVKKNSKNLTSYICPANLSAKEQKLISDFAKKIFNSLECKDVARIDLRVSNIDGKPYFIEINPLPGLVDGFSDLTLIWKSMGREYKDLIKRILNESLKRYGMSTID